MLSKLGIQSKKSAAVDVDYLKLCTQNVRVVEDFADRGNLLNQRQCEDLSSKLLKITPNIRRLVFHSGESPTIFRPALEKLYRHLEKAKALVSSCGEEDWCTAAVFQIQNENAFREILLDIGLCYNVIYEHAKSSSGGSSGFPEDLRPSSLFSPATDVDIQQDEEDLQKRLEDLANDPGSSSLPGSRTLKQCLASYLLLNLKHTSEQSKATTSDTGSVFFWARERQPRGTWGSIGRFLGAGAGASGVCKTEWMGIPCAKKHFNVKESEITFLKEAGILAHLNHPRIVKFLCCGYKKNGGNFIAMELMKKNLLMLIEDRKDDYFPLSIVVDLMVQMARGMCYLHDQGIAHRDLKPQNVVVNPLIYPHLEGHFCLKLVDFGMSKTKVEVSKLHTMSGFGIGTTRYKAPEVYRKAHLSEKGKTTWFKADVFSFAMTCAHVLSLKMPFGDTKVGSLYQEIVNGRRPELPTHCPQELMELLQACWDTIPGARPCFIEICTRLEILQYKLLRGFSFPYEDSEATNFNGGFGFIEAMVQTQSSFKKQSEEGDSNEVDEVDLTTMDDVEDEILDLNEIERKNVPSISCACGGSLEFMHQIPYSGSFWYDICSIEGDKGVYHCATCEFNAHRDCAEIKDEVNVFFHADPLHLLVQYYHDNSPHTTCDFCGESLQGSKWVYNCNECNFNVHALCTKHAQKVNLDEHSHPFTLVQYPPPKHTFCDFCNGDFKGYRYTCTRKQCTINLHPSCIILPSNPLCVFDSSHRLDLVQCNSTIATNDFHCSKCGGLGLSWSYYCKQCEMDIHLDCINDMEVEEVDDWNEAYEQFMVEYENKVNHAKRAPTIAKLLEMLLISSGLDMSFSSTSRPPPVVMRVQPLVQSPASSEANSSIAFDDVDLRWKIVAEAEERKAKRMALLEARQRARVELVSRQGAKLENLERLLQDHMQTMELDAEVLVGAYEKLRKLQDFVHGVITSKMRQVPRIALMISEPPCFGLGKMPYKLLNTHVVTEDSLLILLCEEPGHEHIMEDDDNEIMEHYFSLEKEDLEKFKPFLAAGFHVVKKAVNQVTQITELESVTLPILGDNSWDLRAIKLEELDLQSDLVDGNMEDVELQQRAEDTAAELLRNYFEMNDISIFEEFELVRVRYTTTEQGNCPRYKQGSIAWLCTKHQNQGIEAGVLEPCPLQIYHNLEYDQKRGFL